MLWPFLMAIDVVWLSVSIVIECILIALLQAIRAIEMPQGASQLYTGSQDESVRVWDCTTGQASHSLSC
jgi:WD40 repeat protein